MQCNEYSNLMQLGPQPQQFLLCVTQHLPSRFTGLHAHFFLGALQSLKHPVLQSPLTLQLLDTRSQYIRTADQHFRLHSSSTLSLGTHLLCDGFVTALGSSKEGGVSSHSILRSCCPYMGHEISFLQ